MSEIQELKNEFLAHVERSEERHERSERLMADLISAQKTNTEAIAKLIEDTREIVNLHRDLQGAMRLGQSLQKFTLFMAKWGVAGTVVSAAMAFVYNWIERKF